MKKLFITMSLLLVLVGCVSNKQTSTMNEIVEKMEDTAMLVDVRTKEEFILGHIPNAINIPVDELSDDIAEKDTKIYVYCRSGNRSATAKNNLLKMGFTNVEDLGGIHQWQGDLEEGE